MFIFRWLSFILCACNFALFSHFFDEAIDVFFFSQLFLCMLLGYNVYFVRKFVFDIHTKTV